VPPFFTHGSAVGLDTKWRCHRHPAEEKGSVVISSNPSALTGRSFAAEPGAEGCRVALQMGLWLPPGNLTKHRKDLNEIQNPTLTPTLSNSSESRWQNQVSA